MLTPKYTTLYVYDLVHRVRDQLRSMNLSNAALDRLVSTLFNDSVSYVSTYLSTNPLYYEACEAELIDLAHDYVNSHAAPTYTQDPIYQRLLTQTTNRLLYDLAEAIQTFSLQHQVSLRDHHITFEYYQQSHLMIKIQPIT